MSGAGQASTIAKPPPSLQGEDPRQAHPARLSCYNCSREIARVRKPKLEFCNSVCVRVVPDRKRPVHGGTFSLARCQ